MQKITKKGFTALTAVILLATGSLAFALVVIGNATSYADMVMRHELRIQAKLNVDSCIQSVSLMLDRDFFLRGELHIRDFNCIVYVENNYLGSVSIFATSSISGVTAHKSWVK